jgi:hypothetical protein
MCPLGPGKQSNLRRLSRWSRFSQSNIDAKVPKEFHHLSPMKAPLPVSPQNGMRGGREATSSVLSSGQSTALTRRGFLVAVP